MVRRTLTTLTENHDGLSGMCEGSEFSEKRKKFWASVKPAHFGVKIVSKSLWGIVKYVCFGVMLRLFASTSFGRSLLLKYPEFFTLGGFRKTGPTEEQVNSASFKMWFVGHGYSDAGLASTGTKKPDMEIITRVSGPEIGYLTTPITLVQCALVMLSQRENLPKGGVYTPGILFGPTDLQERLQQNNISFEVISKSCPGQRSASISS